MTFFLQAGNIFFLIFCVVTILQLFFYLRFFRKLAFYNGDVHSANRPQPVSVIICAKDEAANLAKFLPGALVQKYPTTHEVIVVNDNSTDESKYVLEAYQKEFRQLQVVELKQKARFIPGKKFPLSMGIKSSKYDVVLLTDADCVPVSEFWLDKMQSQLNNEIEIVIGYSPFQKKKGLLNKLIRWEGFLSAVQYLSYARCGLAYMGVGRNLGYKKSLFFAQKGFSAFNHLPGGDDDLFINRAATATNVAIAIDPDTFTLTMPATTWQQWRSQKERHYSTSRYYKPVHKFYLGLFAASSFLFYPAAIVSCIYFNWEIVLAIVLFRWAVQYFILNKCAKKLQESDLAPWTPLFDIWMFFYYLIFARSVMKKPRRTWS